MTSSISDILLVSHFYKKKQNQNKLRVVPLFETLDDLINSKAIMNSLFQKIGTEN